MTNELRRIYEELGAFAGFLFPGDVKNIVSDALNPATEAKFSIPFRYESDPVIRAFSAVVENNKCTKGAGPLVVAMCDFVLVDGVQSAALVAVLRSLQKFSEKSESDMALKNLQFCATILPKHFLDVDLLKALFSLVLSLCVHPTAIVSSTAFATSQQMISLFFNFIETSDGVLAEEDVAKIRELVSIRFKNYLLSVAYLLVSDIRCMIFGAPMSWLEVPRLPAPMLFRLWEMIIQSHKKFLVSESAFLDVIESSAVMPIVHNDELPFLVTFITMYMSEFPSTSMAIFSYFLGGCNSNNPKFGTFLMFFRCVCFRNNEFLIEFYERCNPDGSLIGALLESLDNLVAEYLTSIVTFDASPVSEEADFVNINQNELVRTAPVEIVIQMITVLAKQVSIEAPLVLHKSVSTEFEIVAEVSPKPEACNKRDTAPNLSKILDGMTHRKRMVSQDGTEYNPVRSVSTELVDETCGKYQRLVVLVWEKLFSVLVKAIRYASARCIDLVFEAFGNLVRVVVANHLSDARALMLRILCGLIAKQRIARDDLLDMEVLSNTLLHKNKNGLYFKAKRARAYQLALELLSATPYVFTKLYLRLFLALSVYPDAKVDPKFTKLMETPELCKCCGSLVKGNTFCLNLLSKILVLNSDRCETLFKAIEIPLAKHFENPDTVAAAFALIVDVSTAAFNESNETMFLPLFASILERPGVLAEHRIALLNQIRFILLNRSGCLFSGWSAMLRCIAIDKLEPNSELISIAFNILTVICNNHIKKMTIDNLRTIVQLVFQFSSQKVDINIALSSFDLLWVIVPTTHQDIAFWELILSQSIVFVSDRRTDVAICALRTFFSLLMSNAKQLPRDIYPHLVIKCFLPQLMAMDQFPKESWSVHQLTLQEMGHCSLSFWDIFKTIPEFESSFWPLLLQTQSRFIRACKDQEICTNAFQFYELAFPFPGIDQPTRDIMLASFISVVEYLMKHEPPTSLVLSSFGRIISTIFTSQKSFFTDKSLTMWMSLISEMCQELPSESMLNLSAYRVLTSIMSLLPLPQQLMKIITKSMISTIVKCNIPCVRETVLKELTTIFQNHLQNSLQLFIDSKPLFKLDEAADFLKLVSAGSFENCNQNTLFECYFELARDRPDMRPVLDPKMIGLLESVNTDCLTKLVTWRSDDSQILTEIWATFCDPNSPKFNASIANSCFPAILASTKSLMTTYIHDEPRLLQLLRFIETARAPPKKLFNHKQCQTWFFFDIAPELAHLANDDRLEVRRQVKALLTILNRDLTLAVGV